MKKKITRLLAFAVSTLMALSMPVQTVWAETDRSYDEQYPLNRYKDWFAVDPVLNYTRWKWDPLYIGNAKLTQTGDYTPDPRYLPSTPANEYIYRHAVADNDFRYFMNPGTSIETQTFMRLAGVDIVGWQFQGDPADVAKWNSEKEAKIAALEKEMRDFMSSFDWRNASDEEKAVRIAKRIHQADYDHEGAAMDSVTYSASERKDSGYAYGCLVEGKALCGGYTSAAQLLGLCVDLSVAGYSGPYAMNHILPVFLVNGVWLSNEPTQKSQVFQIHDPSNGYYMAGTMKCYEQLGEFCDRTGYQVPETLDGIFQNMTLSDGTQIFKSLAWYDGRNADVMQFR